MLTKRLNAGKTKAFEKNDYTVENFVWLKSDVECFLSRFLISRKNFFIRYGVSKSISRIFVTNSSTANAKKNNPLK